MSRGIIMIVLKSIVYALTCLMCMALLGTQGCSSRQKGRSVKSVAEEEVSGKGSTSQVQGQQKVDKGKRKHVMTHLSSIKVKAVTPPQLEKEAGRIETVIAFDSIGRLAECEVGGVLGEEPLNGTVVIQIEIGTDGKVTKPPQVILTTLREGEEVEKCVGDVIKEIYFYSVSLEKPSTFHVILKYGKGD